MQPKPLITNIQRFSLHDGPGIRTTVFLKGCPLRCPWCSNPENISLSPQRYAKAGEEGIYGKYVSCDEMLAELSKDSMFYGEYCMDAAPINSVEQLEKLPGGVTFSGGEALLQADRLEPLFKALGESRIHMAIETSLFAPRENLKIALDYVDLFYIDIKLLDESGCKNVLGGSLSLYLHNLECVFRTGVPVVFRIPVIGGYTDTPENRKKVTMLLRQYKPIKAELIKGHNLGASKYISLGLKEPGHKEVPDEFLEIYRSEIEGMGVYAQICRI
nr:radical SAM protein [uncultured Acetatifactor sp.]